MLAANLWRWDSTRIGFRVAELPILEIDFGPPIPLTRKIVAWMKE